MKKNYELKLIQKERGSKAVSPFVYHFNQLVITTQSILKNEGRANPNGKITVVYFVYNEHHPSNLLSQ